jgi:DNA-binding NtrC family response regulator
MRAAMIARRLGLLVMSRVGVFTLPLPERGALAIGRGGDCAIHVDDPKASRRHACLNVDADALAIVDLGSANGTFVNGKQLDPHVADALAIGDTITIGSTMLVLQSGAAGAPLRMWSAAAFDARVAEEQARVAENGRPCSILQIALPGDPVLQSATTTHAQLAARVDRAEAFERALADGLPEHQPIGAYGRGEYRVLLVERDAKAARHAADALAEAIRAAGFDATVTVERAADAPAPAAGAIADAFDPTMVDRIAKSSINVLVIGETGVGKEVMARRLHERSARPDAPLLCLNCAAFTETLLESELFGYERGAFTGATHAKRGLLESARGGTVLLDEIGEMSLALQAKLLRVIEQREVQRVGALKPIPIDVRFLAATHRDLDAEARAGRFRADLFFRLNGITLAIPPLRDRLHELEPLARGFVAAACAEAHRDDVPELAPAALALLRRHAWPGNIRELRNVMERAVILCTGDRIEAAHVTLEPAPRETSIEPGLSELATIYQLDPARERARIVEALTACKGNQTQAAKLLGISRRTLVTRLGELDLPRPRKRR